MIKKKWFFQINWLLVFLLVTMMIASYFSVSSVEASEYTVGEDDSSFTSIQNALDAAFDGDRVLVSSGTYTERIFVNKSVEVIGEGASSTFVKGVIASDIVTINADDVTFSGFTVFPDSSINQSILQFQSCISILSSNVQLVDCALTDYLMGVKINFGSSNTLLNCSVCRNKGGIQLYNTSSNLIQDCTIYNNDGYHGVSFQNAQNNVLTNSFIASNQVCGLAVSNSWGNTIHHTIFEENTYGIRMFSSEIKQENWLNVVFNNSFKNNNVNAFDDVGHHWDNGMYGNYWSDYEGSDDGQDGIGDSSCLIAGSGLVADRFPLMESVSLNASDQNSEYSIALISPDEFTIGSELVSLRGICQGANISRVELRVNNGSWYVTNGMMNWEYQWNATQLDPGEYMVTVALVYDNNQRYTSDYVFTVTDEDKVDDGATPGFLMGGLLSLMFLFIVGRKIRNK